MKLKRECLPISRTNLKTLFQLRRSHREAQHCMLKDSVNVVVSFRVADVRMGTLASFAITSMRSEATEKGRKASAQKASKWQWMTMGMTLNVRQTSL
mmetsp:Transcript_116288/g.183895  ORF Transcript_116288/g.183895 Transcript_116288/m.183895 type:complete len:97 (+) Transcript_116288:417-707(+)